MDLQPFTMASIQGAYLLQTQRFVQPFYWARYAFRSLLVYTWLGVFVFSLLHFISMGHSDKVFMSQKLTKYT